MAKSQGPGCAHFLGSFRGAPPVNKSLDLGGFFFRLDAVNCTIKISTALYSDFVYLQSSLILRQDSSG